MKAIVFDKSGTIVDTRRMALDVLSGALDRNVSSTRIVDSMDKGALLILERGVADEIMSANDEAAFADFCRGVDVSFKCIYENTCDKPCLERAMESCNSIPLSFFKKTISAVYDTVGRVRTNNGVVYDIANMRPTHVLSTGGRIIPGVPELFDSLRASGWDIFVATGDTLEGMLGVGRDLGLEEDCLFCFQNAPKKAHSIRRLRSDYDSVVMVGNDSNDMDAFKESDKSILVTQDGLEKKAELFDVADCVLPSITDILRVL